ncbi:hypothetical protein AgCh_020521 [Apium graveolens]
MSENAIHAMPLQLRQLFVFILSNNQVDDPLKIWQQHWQSMADDMLYSRRKSTSNMNLQLSESDIQNIILTGRIVLPVASSDIAATLLPGGRTAQSRFHIPLKLDQHSVAGIKHGVTIGV